MAVKDRISVVIVNYRTPDLTKTCVQSLRKWQVAEDDQIIVVDNASPDDSLERIQRELPGIRLVDGGRNGGFSYGINVGFKYVTNEYLLVLNPDTYFIDDSLQRAVSLLDQRPDVGMIGLDLINPDGSRQFSARRFYSVLDIIGRRLPIGKYWPIKARVNRHMMTSAWDQSEAFEADWVMGTGFVIRKDFFERIGLMDESYFLYMEDVDLCARVWSAGAKVMCIPNARLVHDHQRSSASGPLSRAGRMHLKSLSIFAQKYRLPLFSPPSPQSLRKG